MTENNKFDLYRMSFSHLDEKIESAAVRLNKSFRIIWLLRWQSQHLKSRYRTCKSMLLHYWHLILTTTKKNLTIDELVKQDHKRADHVVNK